MFFFFNDTATTEIYTLSLHDALPIWLDHGGLGQHADHDLVGEVGQLLLHAALVDGGRGREALGTEQRHAGEVGNGAQRVAQALQAAGAHDGPDFLHGHCSVSFIRLPAVSRQTSGTGSATRSEEHTSELQSQSNLVCRLLLDKKKNYQHKLARRLLNHHYHVHMLSIP